MMLEIQFNFARGICVKKLTLSLEVVNASIFVKLGKVKHYQHHNENGKQFHTLADRVTIHTSVFHLFKRFRSDLTETNPFLKSRRQAIRLTSKKA